MKLPLLALTLLIASACGSSPDPGVTLPPTITTLEVTDLSLTTATVSAQVESPEPDKITVKGICWSVQNNPLLINPLFSTENGSGAGAFTAQMTNLLVNKYHVRAYAKVGDQVFYGNEIVADIRQLVPSITVVKKSNIDISTREVQTTITYQHSSPILEKGICWGTTENPTTSNGTKVVEAGAGMTFTTVIGSLSTFTTYYVRGYAITDLGTYYSGNLEILIIPPFVYGNVSDIDGNNYRTVVIGSQTWMADNLKVTKYNDGTLMASLTQNDFRTTTSGAYITYGGGAGDGGQLGYLYNSFAVNNDNVCMTGWHVPSPGEWNLLAATLGGVEDAGGRLKSVTGWTNPNVGADNESGFSGLPGGSYCRVCSSNTGIFADMGTDGYWWSASTSTFFYLTNDQTNLRTKGTAHANDGLSIRCVKD